MKRNAFFNAQHSPIDVFSNFTLGFPGDTTEYPGGISFTHDMGVANVVSRPGFSSYELME